MKFFIRQLIQIKVVFRGRIEEWMDTGIEEWMIGGIASLHPSNLPFRPYENDRESIQCLV